MSISDNYPPMDSGSCMSIGIGGGCGSECPLFLHGDCEEPNQTLEDINNDPANHSMTIADVEELNDMYAYTPTSRKIIPIVPVRGKYDTYDKTMKDLFKFNK